MNRNDMRTNDNASTGVYTNGKHWMNIASALLVGLLGGIGLFNHSANAQVTPAQIIPPPVPADSASSVINPFVRFSPNQPSPGLVAGDPPEGKMSTMAVGEAGAHPELQNPSDKGKVTTMMVGEEGGKNNVPPPDISEPVSEEGQRPSHQPSDNPITTMAVGEEGGVSPQPLP